jgi:sulfhydrogenase subunit delta
MKHRVAFFDFAGCEGCQLQVVNLEEVILDLAGAVDIVSFREAMTEDSSEYDIAFVEGSITRKADEERVKAIRERADILVALGACACVGGVNMLKNRLPDGVAAREVYGGHAALFETGMARPVDAVVNVDCYIRGCPIDRGEFISIVKALLLGAVPEDCSRPVCFECKLAETACVFYSGMTCLGPVTRGGCGAICPRNAVGCLGCRGPVADPALDAELAVLKAHGLTTADAMERFEVFGATWGV